MYLRNFKIFLQIDTMDAIVVHTILFFPIFCLIMNFKKYTNIYWRWLPRASMKAPGFPLPLSTIQPLLFVLYFLLQHPSFILFLDYLINLRPLV